jgi:hypothetical protein
MNTLYYLEFGRFEMAERPMPCVAADEMRTRVAACGIARPKFGPASRKRIPIRFDRLMFFLLLALSTAQAALGDDKKPAHESGTSRPFRIGVESIIPSKDDWFATIYGTWYGKYFTEEQLGNALKEVGAEFTLFYDSIAPKKTNGCVRATDMCQRLGMPFLFNNTYGDIYGPWIPGAGHAAYKQEDLEYARKSGLFRGVIWDEVEHRQLHQVDAGRAPYFVDTKGLTSEQCYEQLVKTIRAAGYHRQGIPDVAEFVFPSMFHIFAEAGMIPAPKVLKESFNPAMIAIAMGAALQYDRELWAVADVWGLVPFWGSIHQLPYEGNPGHSPDEYLSALMTVYWMGADALYTEGLYDLITPFPTTPEEWKEIEENPIAHRGKDNPFVNWPRKRGYILTTYGKYHRSFARHYVPAHPRPYSFREVKPEVAIVAFPDSAWCKPGAAPNWVSNTRLFGPDGPTKEARHGAVFDLWHILTHGKVPPNGLSCHNEPFTASREKIARQIQNNPDDYPLDDPHSGFCPLNGVVVFDHKVGWQRLQGVPLIICTGEMISAETQQAIDTCVRNGAKCLTLPHLLKQFAADAPPAEPRLVPTGKGSYLVAKNFNQPAVQEFVAPHLGPPDEVRYTFGSHTVHLKPTCGDERRLSAKLEPAR